MGTTVLDAGVPLQSGLHVYAHCQRGMPGGVALLVINTDRDAPHALTLPTASVRYTLDAANLLDERVRLNGHPLALAREGRAADHRGRSGGRRHRDVRAGHHYLPGHCRGRKSSLPIAGVERPERPRANDP